MRSDALLKGINLPDVAISAPSLTDKDRGDLAFGVRVGVDYIALSFVRSAEDVREARALVTANIKDFMPLDARYRAASQTHAGLILVSAKTFPQNRTFTAAIASALSALLDQPGQIQPGRVLFLPRR